MVEPPHPKALDGTQDSGGVEERMVHVDGLLQQGDFGSARTVLTAVLERDPYHLPAHERLLQVHAETGNPALAHKEQTRRALLLGGIAGPRADCFWAHAALLYGEMPQGWDLYEARLRMPGLVQPERHFTHPRWNGEPFPGKTLLLHYEQGLGDTLMFVRYAPMVKALGGRVLLAAQQPLANLVATCQGIDEVIPKGTPPPPFDFHFPLLSLPWLFRTEVSSIPAAVPYLSVPARVPNRQAISEILSLAEGRTRVGLTWKGSADHPRDAERSIPAGVLAPLVALPGVAWYGFQREESQELPFPDIFPLGPLLDSFSDTAHALSAMDLLITVDTAVTHLAGALGVPTLLLATHIPDWRWMMDRDDSPWYPTLRVYRQPSAGDWDTVVQRVLSELTSTE